MTVLRRFLGDILTIAALAAVVHWQERRRYNRHRRALAAMGRAIDETGRAWHGQ